jgi:hypothetical protein
MNGVRNLRLWRVHLTIAAIVVMVIAASVLIGVTRQRVGQFAPFYQDAGDAYSEQIVRNTVTNEIIGTENRGGSLIWTKGYAHSTTAPAHRLDYHPDGTVRYYSNRGLQAGLYAAVAAISPESFTAHPDIYFLTFRFVACLMLISCCAVFFGFLFNWHARYLGAMSLMSVTSGIGLFGANLYFQYWLMFAPLLAAPLLFQYGARAYLGAAFAGGLAYFATRYEFATTVALMWLLPVILARYQQPKAMVRLGILVFGVVCLSFVTAILLHLLSVMTLLGTDLSGASALVFEKLHMRVASFTNVPPPFSLGFVKGMLFRWTGPAFYIEDIFSMSKALLLAVFALTLWLDRSRLWWLLCAWALVTYASWYVFSYQHIMQHFDYDAMLFTCTVTLVMVLRICAGTDGLNVLQTGSPRTTYTNLL